MNEKELLKKINNLKDVKPDNNWRTTYREILLSQISASRPVLTPKSDIRIVWESIRPRQILINLAKPVWLASVASVIIMVIGLGGVYGSKNSKPGDSLYIAKIISEKAQFAMTFNEKDKAKLSVGFAANRAKEMRQVLNEGGENQGVNNDKLKILSQNFKKEISQAKKSLTSIKTAQNQANEESPVFGANLGKNNQRMEIAEPAPPAAGNEPATTSKTSVTENPISPAASSTPVAANQANAASTPPADEMLNRAEKLFDEKNLDETIGALEEASQAIEGTGQVEGASETASSTD